MPQEIVVLRCKECLTFQTHESKKSIKYGCKLCGEKQSISRIYVKGTGAECRVACQHLNEELHGNRDEEDVEREVRRFEDRQHRKRLDRLLPRESPEDQAGDSDEMLANDEDCESEDPATDTTHTDSPDTEGHQDEGFEERNVIPDDLDGEREERGTHGTLVASQSDADASPPHAKRSRYSLF